MRSTNQYLDQSLEVRSNMVNSLIPYPKYLTRLSNRRYRVKRGNKILAEFKTMSQAIVYWNQLEESK
jgi:hypothetical protein